VTDPFLRDERQRRWGEPGDNGSTAPGELDPALADVVRQLRAESGKLAPDPTYAKQLREDLMNRSISAGTVPFATVPAAWPSPNGRAVPRSWIESAPGVGRARTARRWNIVQLVAAVLLLTVGIGYVAIDPFGGPDRPASIPAAVVADATPAPAANSADEPAIEVAFPAAPFAAGPISAGLTRYTLDAGAAGAYPGYPVAVAVAAVLLVQSGTMGLSGDLVAVHRSAETAPASPAAGEALLGPGDAVALEVGPDRAYALRNAGADPLVFVEAWVFGGDRWPRGEFGPAMHGGEAFSITRVTDLASAGAVTVRLTRATLAPDETRTPPDGGWQIVLGKTTDLVRGGEDGTAHNISPDAQEVVILTARFETAGATPVP